MKLISSIVILLAVSQANALQNCKFERVGWKSGSDSNKSERVVQAGELKEFGESINGCALHIALSPSVWGLQDSGTDVFTLAKSFLKYGKGHCLYSGYVGRDRDESETAIKSGNATLDSAPIFAIGQQTVRCDQ